MFDKKDFQRFAVSAVGALTLSAACVLGAAGPARAATPVSVADWQRQVESRIDRTAEMGHVYNPSDLRKAEVAVQFTADGDYAGAKLARTSGDPMADKRAVEFASQLRYPALPQDMLGLAQTVTMRLYFGDADAYDRMMAHKNTDQVASADRAGIVQIAAR